jgi:hypothetical protein
MLCAGENIVCQSPGCVYFSSEEAAEGAIKDVARPFLESHPEFKMFKEDTK